MEETNDPENIQILSLCPDIPYIYIHFIMIVFFYLYKNHIRQRKNIFKL